MNTDDKPTGGATLGTPQLGTMSRAGNIGRCLLYVVIGLGGYLQTDETFRAHVPWWVMTMIGGTVVVAAMVRAYLDRTAAMPETGVAVPPLPVTVTNEPEDAVPTKEAP